MTLHCPQYRSRLFASIGSAIIVLHFASKLQVIASKSQATCCALQVTYKGGIAMRSKKDLMIEFSIDMRTVKKRLETALVNPEQSGFNDDEYLRFIRVCELLAEKKTHSESTAIISKEFDIEIVEEKKSSADGSENASPELMATDGAIQLGGKMARIMAKQTMAVAAQLFPLALEEELMDPRSDISRTIANVAHQISSSSIDMQSVRNQAINARRERLLLASDEIVLESEQFNCY